MRSHSARAPFLRLLLVQASVFVNRSQLLLEQAIGGAVPMIVPDVDSLALAGTNQLFIRIFAIRAEIFDPVAADGLVRRVRERLVNLESAISKER